MNKCRSFVVKAIKSSDANMSDYCDGIRFRDNEFYNKFPKALQIQLYFDDLETTNPLGSKTKVHKLGAVYFCLRNIPARFNSSLENIHLCLLFNSIDREVYGFNSIFKPLLEDLNILETRGVEVQIHGKNSLLHGTLCLFTADNLACHSVGGFFESFSANRFCHICLVHKQNAQHIFNDDLVELRNRDNYSQHVELNNPPLTGIKEDSCLNSLNFFLNSRIAGFDYGLNNMKSKPSAIIHLRTSENPIRQNASQMWCLLLFLPFLIGDFIDEGNKHWQLFILLRQICDIIFAPVATKGLAMLLKQLVIDHHTLFKSLYDRPLIPKHHFMTHYWRMVYFGPLGKLWCMRFEGKHAPLKRQAQVVCNFINISKTLAFKHQVQAMFNWKLGSPLKDKMTVANSFPVLLGSLKEDVCLIDNLTAIGRDVGQCSSVHVAHSVTVFGQRYQTTCILPLNRNENGELVFGEVMHILPESENLNVLFFLRILVPKFFHNHFHAIAVQRTEDFKLISIRDLIDFRPMHLIFFNNDIFVNPRYELV